MKIVKAVRGAVILDEDSRENGEKWILKMAEELIKVNRIEEKNIISVQFTQTKDINKINPATLLRQIGFDKVALFCSQEPDITGSKEKVIRVMFTFYSVKRHKCIPVYLNGAEGLRKDLYEGKKSEKK